MALSTAFAFHRANGVMLCKSCHAKTDSYCGRGHTNRAGSVQFVIKTIPHHWQDYPTCGNWFVGDNHEVGVLVSEMGDSRYEHLVGIHEMIEAGLCHNDGITPEQIDQFDMQFEADRLLGRHPPDAEPGDDPRAPYRRQHLMATAIEKMLAAAMGVDWKAYEDAVNGL